MHYTNRIKDKYHMIISIDAKNIPQNPKPFHDKNIQQTTNRKKHPNLDYRASTKAS